MKYRLLGRTGLKVSELCLGTMTFGDNFLNIAVVDQAGANQMVARCLDAGINFFDTADVYAYGQSETILGQALKDCGTERDKIVIATKVRGSMSEGAMQGTGDVNNVGLSRQHIFASVEKSLRRLATDYIDLYQVHGWDMLTPVEETLRALDDLVRQGKVRYIGCSNWSARHLMKALVLSATERLGRLCFAAGLLLSGGTRSRTRAAAALSRRRCRRAAVVAFVRRISFGQVPARQSQS